jgi:hypothetical protein
LAQKKFRNIGNHATKKGHESNEGWFGKANKGDENNNESKGKQESFGKGKAKPPHKLNKTNLDKLGKMSLDDKIRQAATEGETPEEQAIVLKGILRKDEHSKLWGRYKTHVGKNPDEKEEVDNLPKKDKGLKAAQWLMEREGKKYMHVRRSVEAQQTLNKKDAWESHKEMVDRFGEDELEAHTWSGRVMYRQDPSTPGVWQYKDTQCWSSNFAVKRGSQWEQGAEMEPDSGDLEKFSELQSSGWKNLGVEDLEDGSKGKSFGKGKGKGFGKGKGKTEQLALEDKKDEEKTEDERKDALKKARKARDSVASTLNDLEDALGKASSKLSRQGKAAAEGWKVQLNKQLADLKGALSGKKTKKASDMKKMLEEAAKVIKGSKDEAKELKALGNKAASVASSKRSRASK